MTVLASSQPCTAPSECSESTSPASTLAAQWAGAERIPLPLEFAPGESRLAEAARNALAHWLDCARTSDLGEARLLVLGHAHPDEAGGEPVLALAHDRADTVARHLREAGIGRVSVRGAELSEAPRAGAPATVELWQGGNEPQSEPTVSPPCAP